VGEKKYERRFAGLACFFQQVGHFYVRARRCERQHPLVPAAAARQLIQAAPVGLFHRNALRTGQLADEGKLAAVSTGGNEDFVNGPLGFKGAKNYISPPNGFASGQPSTTFLSGRRFNLSRRHFYSTRALCGV
jgi:hypothetical protein